jgi:hypothetical protein
LPTFRCGRYCAALGESPWRADGFGFLASGAVLRAENAAARSSLGLCPYTFVRDPVFERRLLERLYKGRVGARTGSAGSGRKTSRRCFALAVDSMRRCYLNPLLIESSDNARRL